MRRRICNKCGKTIEYDANPDTYSKPGSYPIDGDPACTVQAAMEIVEIDGEYFDICLECLPEYKVIESVEETDKKEKLKKWVKGK